MSNTVPDAEPPTSCEPASELSDEMLVQVLIESYARSFMYPDSEIQHSRWVECKGEVLSRLTRADIAARSHVHDFQQIEGRSSLECACGAVPDPITGLAARSEGEMAGWRDGATAPRDGTAFRAYNPALVHPDFNPWGTVEAVFDGEKFVGAAWDGVFDCWNTVEVTPESWQPLTGPKSLASAPADEVREALAELLEMGFMRARIERVKVSDTATLAMNNRVEISLWRKQASGKVIHGDTVAEAMQAVREWRDKDNNK